MFVEKSSLEEDKKEEIGNTMTILNDQIVVMEKEIAKIKGGLEENIDMWNKYELSAENLSSWLKDIEEKVRQVTGAHVNFWKRNAQSKRYSK